MTARELLELNGDFKHSPLIKALQRVHRLFSALGVPYAVIGGMAVVRHGSGRTTRDIDILTTRKGWSSIRRSNPSDFVTGLDHARDMKNGVEIDILFAGNDWDMVINLPDPREVSEYDEELKANFICFSHLIELKCAVYQQKMKEFGIEIAAKDLADIVELAQSNTRRITDSFIAGLHPGVRETFREIWANIKNKGK